MRIGYREKKAVQQGAVRPLRHRFLYISICRHLRREAVYLQMQEKLEEIWNDSIRKTGNSEEARYMT